MQPPSPNPAVFYKLSGFGLSGLVVALLLSTLILAIVWSIFQPGQGNLTAFGGNGAAALHPQQPDFNVRRGGLSLSRFCRARGKIENLGACQLDQVVNGQRQNENTTDPFNTSELGFVLIEAMENPKHPEHQDVLHWYTHFDR